MTTLARAVFAALVVATFGAFFVAQRLKNTPTVIQKFYRTPVFSPNHDGRYDGARFTFLLKHADDVDVDVVNGRGDVVKTLADGRHLRPYKALPLPWDGTDDAGREVPDGLYRARVTLRKEGRTVTVPKSIRKDTTPPKPAVQSIGPEQQPVPELLPRQDGRPAKINIVTPGLLNAKAPRRKRVKVTVWRTDGDTPVRVTSSGSTPLLDSRRYWSWNGEVNGRRVRPGTYLAVVESRDEAGNIGYSVPMQAGKPRLEYGRRLPGRAGITVRYLGVQPPSVPITAGQKADVLIDARGERWRYTLRRVGSPDIRARSKSSGTGFRLPLRAPGTTGTYLLTVRTRTHAATVPIVVQAAQPVGRVLVVLPWITWQGRNQLDDDGDGRPNTLDGGVGVRANRVFAGNGLPVDFGIREAPVLAFLDRTRRDYDLTTDLALAQGVGPKLAGFKGVLIPGDARWLPAKLATQLKRFAEAGGTVVSLGTASLRRQVDLAGKRLVKPTNPTQADLFGAVIDDVTRGPANLTVADDKIDLFQGDEGEFPRVSSYEVTQQLGAPLAADAVSPAGAAGPVIAATRVGQGLVVRTGIPDFPQRLTPHPESAALMNRLWVLLARGVPAG